MGWEEGEIQRCVQHDRDSVGILLVGMISEAKGDEMPLSIYLTPPIPSIYLSISSHPPSPPLNWSPRALLAPVIEG